MINRMTGAAIDLTWNGSRRLYSDVTLFLQKSSALKDLIKRCVDLNHLGCQNLLDLPRRFP
jgi:hypothetical protein